MAGQVPQNKEEIWEKELRRYLESIVYKKLVKTFGEYIYKVGYTEWPDGEIIEEDWLDTHNVVDYIVNDIVNAIKLMIAGEYEGCLEIYDEDVKKAVKEINDKYNLGLWLC